MVPSITRRRGAFPSRVVAVACAAAVLVPAAAPAAAAGEPVRVMTRNLYLGADLGPATRAGNLQELVNAAGVILRQVDRNRFAVRARGLAAEIRQRRPHLVGMQEVALWRTGPCQKSPIPPSAQTVRHDFLQLLLRELNRGGQRYRVAVAQDQFDFEVYVNRDGDESTSAPGCPLGSELNGRLTMRDVILVRRDGVSTTNARGGTFETQLRVTPGGVPVDIVRGWTRVDAKVSGAPRFRFVNTHLEAFDNQQRNRTTRNTVVGNGQVRAAQARELVAAGGPARSAMPVILLGDFNSDTRTAIRPGDGRAYRVLRNAGFVERNARTPLSCCLERSLLHVSAGGRRSDFDHKVDAIFTDSPSQVGLLRAEVTGLQPVNRFWSSDHAGLFSVLRVTAPRARFTG